MRLIKTKGMSAQEKRSEKGGGACYLPPYEAPPPYTEVGPPSRVLEARPPPYLQQNTATLLGELKAELNNDPEERCSSCFDPIRPDKAEGFSGNAVWQGMKVILVSNRKICMYSYKF